MSVAAIYSRLANDAAVTALVSTRIYPSSAPQDDVRPYLVLHEIVAIATNDYGGDIGFVNATMQVDCWADTYAAAKSLRNAVRDALSGWAGTAASVLVHGIHLLRQRDVTDFPRAAEEREIFGVQMDFRVLYRENKPALA